MTSYQPNCGFCGTLDAIFAGDHDDHSESGVRAVFPDAVILRPNTGGVHPHHVMVVPRIHVVDAIEEPIITGAMFARGAEYLGRSYNARYDWNMAVNIGSDAGQTAPHLHVHLWPREAGDRLCMPWDCRSGQEQRERERS